VLGLAPVLFLPGACGVASRPGSVETPAGPLTSVPPAAPQESIRPAVLRAPPPAHLPAELDPLTISPSAPRLPEEGLPAMTDRRRVEHLLRRAGAEWSDKIPVESRPALDGPVELRPESPAAAWREYRRAWLQDDPEAAYALLSEPARGAIAAQLKDWQERARRTGVAGLSAYLRFGSGLSHHAIRIDAAGLDRYGVRAWFDTAWADEHSDPRRVREMLNCREVGAEPQRDGSARVKVEFVGPLTDELRERTIRVVREADGVWRVEPELR
jgi:hypothetical protein